MAIDRSEYRDHIIEITLLEETRARWQGDWAVFETEPFRAVGAGMLADTRETAASARAAAWRAAANWVDAYVGGSGTKASGRRAVSAGKRR